MGKRTWLLIGIFAIVPISGCIIFFLLGDGGKPETLILELPSEIPWRDAIAAEIRHFDAIQPRLEVRIIPRAASAAIDPLSDTALIVADTPRLSVDQAESERVHLWTGDVWRLIVRPSLIGQELLQALRSAATVEDFTAVLQRIQNAGITPLSVGNSHYWPLALWDQHLNLALGDRGASLAPVEFPAAGTPGSRILRDWYERGFFLEEYWNDGWVRGIRAPSEGSAAAALFSGRMLGSLAKDQMAELEFIPFPQGSSPEPWAVGRGIFIYIMNPSEKAAAYDQLFSYLTSESVTAKLSRETGQLFYSTATGEKTRMVTSWEKLANDPAMRSYGQDLNRFVNGSRL